MCDILDSVLVDELCVLKNTRDNVDVNVHNALVACAHNQKMVYISKIESLNAHDMIVKVSYTTDIKEELRKDKNIIILNAFTAFYCNLECHICWLLRSKKYDYNTFLISRYELKELVKHIGQECI